MNSRQLQYAILLSQVKNFSQVAEQLNITQPALSKQIMQLEKDLGVELFDRKVTPLRLTPAGEHFIREAKQLLYDEEQLRRSMESFRSGQRGKLTIGISPFRSLYLIPPVVKKVREKYPWIEISLHETNSDQLRKDALESKFDFAVVNLPVDKATLDYIPIEPDVLVLAVPNKFLPLIDSENKENLSEISFKDCARLPFIVIRQSQELGQLFERFCAAEETRPQVAMEVVGLTTAWAMARAGIGAALLPLQFVRDESFRSENITLFKIKNNVHRRQPVIVFRRGQYLPEYAEYAIEILKATDR